MLNSTSTLQSAYWKSFVGHNYFGLTSKDLHMPCMAHPLSGNGHSNMCVNSCKWLLLIPFNWVLAVEWVNGITWPFLDFCLLPTLQVEASPCDLHPNSIIRMSLGNQFKSLHIKATYLSYASKPLRCLDSWFMATCRDFTAATSSPPWQFITLAAGLFCFLN